MVKNNSKYRDLALLIQLYLQAYCKMWSGFDLQNMDWICKTWTGFGKYRLDWICKTWTQKF